MKCCLLFLCCRTGSGTAGDPTLRKWRRNWQRRLLRTPSPRLPPSPPSWRHSSTPTPPPSPLSPPSHTPWSSRLPTTITTWPLRVRLLQPWHCHDDQSRRCRGDRSQSTDSRNSPEFLGKQETLLPTQYPSRSSSAVAIIDSEWHTWHAHLPLMSVFSPCVCVQLVLGCLCSVFWGHFRRENELPSFSSSLSPPPHIITQHTHTPPSLPLSSLRTDKGDRHRSPYSRNSIWLPSHWPGSETHLSGP